MRAQCEQAESTHTPRVRRVFTHHARVVRSTPTLNLPGMQTYLFTPVAVAGRGDGAAAVDGGASAYTYTCTHIHTHIEIIVIIIIETP